MPKFPTIPRLSIVVPYLGNIQAFESSLASVLQHRPDACEVIVPHAGDYDDPFDLGDEVKFLNAGTSSFTRQIGEAAAIARGRFINVVANGHRVTADWSGPALESFEHHDAGFVVPVVRREGSEEIVQSGWRRSASAACELIAVGRSSVQPRDSLRVEGGFLAASFWRRDLLRSLTGTIRSEDPVEVSMVYSLLARQAGWRCIVSRESTLRLNDDVEVNDYQTAIHANHRRLQAIVDQLNNDESGWGKCLGRFVSSCFSSGVGSAVRRATAPMAYTGIMQILRCDGVLRCDRQGEAIRIPVHGSESLRRAA